MYANILKQYASEIYLAPRAKLRKSALKCPISEFYPKLFKTPKLKGTMKISKIMQFIDKIVIKQLKFLII